MLLMSMMWAPGAHAQTAAEMASYCGPYRHALRLAPRGGSSPVVEAPGANARSDFCWGAFATLQTLANLQQIHVIQLTLTDHPRDRLCIPITVERLQLVKTFLQYMDDHHELGNTDFGVALINSMFQAFPCAPTSG